MQSAVMTTPNASQSRQHETRDTTIALALIFIAAATALWVAVTYYLAETNQFLATLSGQHVDSTASDFVPPDLKVTMSLPGGRATAPGAWTRFAATVENQGSGTLVPNVTIMVPLDFGMLDVKAPREFECKTRIVPFVDKKLYHLVLCKKGKVHAGKPAVITVSGVMPAGDGQHLVGASAEMRFGVKDPNKTDNAHGLFVSTAGAEATRAMPAPGDR